MMEKNSVKFIKSTRVAGQYIEGTISHNRQFIFNKLLGKNLSLGYCNHFSKEKLADLIAELQEVHDNLGENEKDEE